MLTPDYLSHITDRVVAMSAKLNNDLTARIAKRIAAFFDKSKDVELIPSSVSDARKLKESGMALEEIQTALARQLPSLQKEIKEAFLNASAEIERESGNFTKNLAASVGLDGEEQNTGLTKAEKALIEQEYEKTNGTFENLTGTTASAWQKKYIEIIDQAYWNVRHGMSQTQAVSAAIDEAAKYGTVVEYPSGHVDRIEVAIARAVRTGINQAAGDATLARCAALGVSQVVVSSHLGARYTKRDEPANHMSWQGKVYDLDWTNETLSKYNVTVGELEDTRSFLNRIKERVTSIAKKRQSDSAGDFIAITGYGTGEGLCGWNCRHSFSQFYPGINTNNADAYDSDENIKRYDLDQKKRAAERKLRDIKRRLEADKAAYEAVSDGELKDALRVRYENTLKKHTALQAEYLKFCRDNNLTPEYDRLKIGTNESETNAAAEQVAKVENDYLVRIKEEGAGSTELSNLTLYKDARYNNSEEYMLLSGYEKAVKNGDISPLVGFDVYKEIADELDKKLIGITTSGGVTVESYATHLIDRIIGQTSTPHAGMRQGVPVDTVINTLENGQISAIRYLADGDVRQTYSEAGADVSLSVRDKRVIQTNPGK